MGEKKEKEEKIGEALLKVALGYQVAEVTEEYVEVDGEMKLTKRKRTKKDVPPDLKAVQLLLASEGVDGYAQWTDEELETERQRLIGELKKETEKEKEKEKEKKKGSEAVKKKSALKNGKKKTGGVK